MPIRLICIDIDGTLIGPANLVHPSTWPALAAARAAGVGLALSTGRPAFGAARELARGVTPDGFHVFQNGATIVQCLSDGTAKLAQTAPLPLASYRALVEAARERSLALEVYSAFDLYLERHDANTEKHQEVIEITAKQADLLSLEADSVVRVQWVVPFADLPPLVALTEGLAGLEIAAATTPDMPGIAFASVTRQGTSKLTAAQWLADQQQVLLSETAMIGDGEGDISALLGCGYGIAMGNSNDKVKAAAKQIVARVEDGGLAEAMMALLAL
jgi:Cof subfamily protein (haloacid dehalogenase superfamily)